MEGMRHALEIIASRCMLVHRSLTLQAAQRSISIHEKRMRTDTSFYHPAGLLCADGRTRRRAGAYIPCAIISGTVRRRRADQAQGESCMEPQEIIATAETGSYPDNWHVWTLRRGLVLREVAWQTFVAVIGFILLVFGLVVT